MARNGEKMAQKYQKIEKWPQIPFFRQFWAIFSPFRAEGHFLFFGQFFPILGFRPVFHPIPGGLTRNCKPHFSLFWQICGVNLLLGPMISGNFGTAPYHVLLPFCFLAPMRLHHFPAGTQLIFAQRDRTFGPMSSMTRCICMRTLKTELHTCRHSNNYAHNLCFPNHKETNGQKVEEPDFAILTRTRPWGMFWNIISGGESFTLKSMFRDPLLFSCRQYCDGTL